MPEFILDNKFIKPVIILFLLFITYFIIRNILDKIINFRTKAYNADIKKVNTIKSLFTNVLKYVFIFISVVVILDAFGVDTSTLIAGLGVLSVVIGLSLQDILKDFFAGIFIIVENQFQVGDTVEIGGFKGEVVSLGLKTTRIKKFTGEVRIISNRSIDSIINYSAFDSTDFVDVRISNESDVEKVNKILEDLCEKLSGEIEKLKGKIEVLGIEELNGGAMFRVSFVAKPMERYDIRRKILKAIKIEFDKKGIKIL